LDGSNAAANAWQTAENAFAAPVNTSLSLDTSAAVQTATSNLGSIPTTLDADKSVKGIRDSVKDGIELDVAAKSGVNGILDQIKGFVETIKEAVVTLEKKLPVAALI
jgi:serine/threonine-protein kinase RIO1